MTASDVIGVQVQSVQGRLFKIAMVVTEDGNPSWLDVEMRAKAEGELYPARDEDPAEMSVSDDHDISPSDSVLEVFPVDFLDGFYDLVDAFGHFIGALTARAPRSPNGPVFVLLLNLSRRETFIISIIPFTNFFGDGVLGKFRQVGEQQLESLRGAYSR